MKKVNFVVSVLFLGSAAFVQDAPKLEVALDYSYVHANPQNNNIIPTFSLNGGGGSVAVGQRLHGRQQVPEQQRV